MKTKRKYNKRKCILVVGNGTEVKVYDSPKCSGVFKAVIPEGSYKVKL